MKVACPNCRQHYEVEDSEAGKLFDCPSCKQRFQAFPLAANKVFPSFDEKSNTKLMECPDCGKMISCRARWCPHCGCYDETNTDAKNAKPGKVEVISFNPSVWDMMRLIICFWVASFLLAIIAIVALGVVGVSLFRL